MEHRGHLELRQVSRADRLDHHPLHAHCFSLPARLIRSGRTPAPLPTKSRRLLFGVHLDVRARHRADRNPRRSLSSCLVRPLCWSLRRAGCHRSRCPPTRVRSVLRVVSTDHAANLGALGKKVPRARYTEAVEFLLVSGLDCHPFVTRTRIGDSLDNAHVANAVFEIRMRTYAAL